MPSWNQPLCDPCWTSEEPRRSAHRLAPTAREVEACCMCGNETVSGIYVRRDPATASDEAVERIRRILGGEVIDGA